MQLVLEQGFIDNPLRWFDTTQFSYQCVHLMHAKGVINPNVPIFQSNFAGVCTLELFICTFSGGATE